ncbi:X-Pro dipeptidyl-peptidase C-terminal non-catalytic domain-containing protein [Xylariales sp. PMI_506]|nr:X-Pro dipeptidyl-peptidase C-terminal non-catalytic domain-containing protein [Xylariales sp. PMI_506]
MTMTSTATAFPKAPIVPLGAPEIGQGGYQGLNPRSETLPMGWKYPHPDARPLSSPILVEHDVPITMRDGAVLRADIYRPPGSEEEGGEKVPAVLAWSPFGKKFNGLMSLALMTPWDLGLPAGTLSGLEKFEGPDPADWVPRGYAIVNIDNRGVGDSDGTMVIMGTQEAEDGYDTVEALAKLPWCSGAVGMAGNSHLAIAQWFVAALRPPSLKAIAPWEACGDLYREQFARGGIYAGDMFDHLIVKYMLKGRHGYESFREKFVAQPLADAWWNDKRPDIKKINIPTYITGTWTNTMHGMGAIRGWMEVDTEDKWMRWHGTQEWYDMYGNKEGTQELIQFFDRYLKGLNNGWEKTPKIRMAALRFGQNDPIENIVEDSLPIARTQYRELYFTAEGKLDTSAAPGETATLSYNSESADSVSFTYTFPEATRIMGMPKAVLYASCADLDDMDVYVFVEKLDTEGRPMTNLNIPWKGVPVKSFDEFTPEQRTEVVTYKGPLGILRASHRAIDESRSIHPNWPFHPHEKEDKIPPGTVVRLDIGIWAMGVQYEAGEGLRVSVSGRSAAVSNFGTFDHVVNKGRHHIHLGGEYPSHVILPFV